MSDQVERSLRSFGGQLPRRVSLPGEDGYAAATAIWAKPVGPMPRAALELTDVLAKARSAGNRAKMGV